jgi:hypothetical protein
MDIILPSEPVRKIRSGQRGIRGNVPGKGRFESTLEGDLMDLLRFSNSIEDFKPQPIRIPYTLPNGRPSRYTPDGLIFFKRHLQHSPVLYEVKYRDDYKHSWQELRLKFRAARELCRNQGWAFRVFTEFHIRTPYLANVQFLQAYKDQLPAPEMSAHVLDVIEDLQQGEVNTLLAALARDLTTRAEWIPVVWHLVAVGTIHCNLDEPLTMCSILTATGAADA